MSSFEKRFRMATLYIYSKMPPTWGYTKSFWIFLAFLMLDIWNDLRELVKWNNFDGLNAKEIMNRGWLHVVHLNGPTKNNNVNHQQNTIWHLWKKELTLTMETHMLVIIVSSSTRSFIVSRTNEYLDVLIRLIGMVHINVWSPCLKVMNIVPNVKTFSRKPIDIQILG
jgi:hypothetical protein